MYSKILDYLGDKPPVYYPGTSAFWDAINISKHMLEAHLAVDVEAASRNLLFVQESVDWIASICNFPEKRRVLLMERFCQI